MQTKNPKKDDKGSGKLEVFALWKEYEKIAMHFNGLLIRLRTQALAGVAALATVVGIFTKFGTDQLQGAWEIATGIFGALCLFWIAIWFLDIFYYNRLLTGAVAALLELEKKSETDHYVSCINMSTRIEQAVETILPNSKPLCERLFILRGVLVFYVVVFFALGLAFSYSLYKFKTL